MAHSVETLKELMDERDRRYAERFTAQEKAVDLARAAAAALRNASSVSGVLALIALLLTLADRFK